MIDEPRELQLDELNEISGGGGNMPPFPGFDVQNISQFVSQVSSGGDSMQSYSQSASISVTQG